MDDRVRKAVGIALMLAAAAVGVPLIMLVMAAPICAAVEGETIQFGLVEMMLSHEGVLGFALRYPFRLVEQGHLPTAAVSFVAIAAVMGLGLFQMSLEYPGREVEGGVLGRQKAKRGPKAVPEGAVPWDGGSEPDDGVCVGFAGGRAVVVPCVHAVVCAPSGAGKTRGSVYPTVDALSFAGRNSLVVTDPSLEILAMAGPCLEARGYGVHLVDLERPGRGSRFNPLRLITDLHDAGDLDGAEAQAREVGAALFPAQGTENDVFVNAAAGAFAAVAYHVATSPEVPEGRRHLWSVVRTVLDGTAGGTAPLKAWVLSLGPDSPCGAMAATLMASESRMESSILATLHEGLQPYTSRNMRWLTSASDVAPSTPLSGRSAVFLHTMGPGSPANKVASLFMSQLWAEEQRLGARRANRPVWVVGDEWHSVPRFGLVHAMEQSRKYGLHFVMYLQSFSGLDQYRTRLENGKDAILSNCDLKALYRAGSVDDARYFEALSGMRTVRTMSTGTSYAANGGSSSSSYTEHQLPVWPAGDILARDPAEDGVLVARGAGPGHAAGLYEVPFRDAGKTFVAGHLGTLGTREEEALAIAATLDSLDARAASRAGEVKAWTPDFSRFRQRAEGPGTVALDEGLAWD